MGTQPETRLQQRIQSLIKSRGGYVHKNWGNMTTNPGVADLTVCYKGMYLAIEVKEKGNTPSPAQGIQARLVNKAGGISCVVWSVEEVEKILNLLDEISVGEIREDCIHSEFERLNIDNGSRW